MAEAEGAQEGPDGGGGHHPVAKHAGAGPRAQHLDVVDTVPTGNQAVDHSQDLAARSGGTGPPTEVDQLVGGLLQPQPRNQRGGQQQPGVGHRPLVVERGIDPVQDDVGRLHRKLPPACGEWLGS